MQKRADVPGALPSDGPALLSNETCPISPPSPNSSSIASSSSTTSSSIQFSSTVLSLSTSSSLSSTSALVSLTTSTTSTISISSPTPASATSTPSTPSDPLFNQKCPLSPNSNCRSYVLITKSGTSTSIFSAFWKGHQDQGGFGIHEEYDDDQMYVTTINSTTVDKFRAMDFVDVLAPNDGYDGGAFGLGNADRFWQAKEIRKRADSSPGSPEITQRANSSSNLRLLSQAPSKPIPDSYKYDSKAGNGTIIYVIDTGFNLRHAVSSFYYVKSHSLMVPGFWIT
jgi:hypothetical protein